MLSPYHLDNPRHFTFSAELVNLGQKPLLIVCAYEGTLTPNNDKPELSPPYHRVRNALAALIGHPKHQMMVFSGLRDSQIDNLINLPPLTIIGLHGLQWPGSFLPAPDWRNLDRLSNQLLQIEGLRLEHKGWTLAAHFDELRPAKLLRLMAQLDKVQLPDGWEVINSNKTREYIPKGYGKAQTIERLVAENPFHHLVYFAQDSSNEVAFAVLKRLGGTAIKVGKGPTKAALQLPGPDEVVDLLEVWAQFST